MSNRISEFKFKKKLVFNQPAAAGFNKWYYNTKEFDELIFSFISLLGHNWNIHKTNRFKPNQTYWAQFLFVLATKKCWLHGKLLVWQHWIRYFQRSDSQIVVLIKFISSCRWVIRFKFVFIVLRSHAHIMLSLRIFCFYDSFFFFFENVFSCGQWVNQLISSEY